MVSVVSSQNKIITIQGKEYEICLLDADRGFVAAYYPLNLVADGGNYDEAEQKLRQLMEQKLHPGQPYNFGSL